MTTVVETAEDFIRIMRERPDILAQVRREILTDAVLNLPEQFALLTQRVDEIAVQLAHLTQRVDALTQRVDEIAIQLAQLTQRVDDLTQRVDTLTIQVAEIVVRLKNLQEVQDQHSKTLDEHSEILKDHTQRLDRVEYRLDQLVGSDLERKARKIVQARLNRRFSLRRTRVSHDQFASNGPFIPAVEAAADDGKIDDAQEERLKLTDLIIRARPKPDSPLGFDTDRYVWFPVEVSGRIEDDDIDRAERSAVALRAMYGENALPIVAGYRISDEDRALAEERDVTVFIIPDLPA